MLRFGSRSSILTRALYQCRVTLRRSDCGRAQGFGCSPAGCFLSVQDPCGIHPHLISLTRLCRRHNTIFPVYLTCRSVCPSLSVLKSSSHALCTARARSRPWPARRRCPTHAQATMHRIRPLRFGFLHRRHAGRLARVDVPGLTCWIPNDHEATEDHQSPRQTRMSSC